MIDWDSATWGGGVTEAADGSWVADRHTEGSTKDAEKRTAKKPDEPSRED